MWRPTSGPARPASVVRAPAPKVTPSAGDPWARGWHYRVRLFLPVPKARR